MRGTRFGVICLLWLVIPTTLWAQSRIFGRGNYRTVLLGGRTAAMGGTGVAAGSDSAMPILNPAGLAGVGAHNISMSASVYGIRALDVSDFTTAGLVRSSPGFGTTDRHGPIDHYRSQTVDSWPSSFVYSWPLGAPVGQAGHHVLSFSILTPYRSQVHWLGYFGYEFFGIRMESEGESRRSGTVYQIGPSYAVQLTSNFRVGASLGLHYANDLVTTSDATFTRVGSDLSILITGLSSRFYSLDLAPVVGFQWQATPRFSLGASVTSPSIQLASEGTQRGKIEHTSSDSLEISGGPPSLIRLTAYDFERSASASPLHITAGLDYRQPKSWRFAADLHYYGPLDVVTHTGPKNRGRIADGYRGADNLEPSVQHPDCGGARDQCQCRHRDVRHGHGYCQRGCLYGHIGAPGTVGRRGQ